MSVAKKGSMFNNRSFTLNIYIYICKYINKYIYIYIYIVTRSRHTGFEHSRTKNLLARLRGSDIAKKNDPLGRLWAETVGADENFEYTKATPNLFFMALVFYQWDM